MTISVAIPVFNGEKYIQETLESVINQTRRVDKIIICDNRSTDNTVKIVHSILKENHKPIIQLHINENNIGHRKNFNKCFELSDEDFTIIMSCDDLLHPDAIKILMKSFEQNPKLALAGAQYNIIDSKGKFMRNVIKTDNTIIFKKGEIIEFIEKTASWIPQSIVLMNMNLVRKIGKFDERYLGFDELYWPKVLVSHPIALLENILVSIREHEEQDGSLAYVNKFKEVIAYLNERRKLYLLEIDSKKRSRLKKILHRQVANSSFFMARKVWVDYMKYFIALKYYIYGITISPIYFFKRYAYKILLFFYRPVKKLFQRLNNKSPKT